MVIVIAAFFALGIYGLLSRRDIVGVLASIEIMLGSAAMLAVVLASTMSDVDTAANGQAFGLFIVILAAAEAAVGLALLVTVASRRATTRVDELVEVQG